MKKKIFIGVLFIVLLTLVAVIVLTLIGDSGTSSNKGSVDTEVDAIEKELFSLSNFEEFSKFASNKKFEVYYFDGNTTAEVIGFEFLKSISDMTVYFDEEKTIKEINIYSQLYDISKFSSDGDVQSIEEKIYNECRDIIQNFADVFDVQYAQNLQLTNYDGTFCDVVEMTDMSSFVNEEAYVNFAIRDKVGHYYVMQIFKSENILEANITKYYDAKAYLDYFADISLYDEEEN